MTISMKRAAFLLSSTIAAGMYGSVSYAADIAAPSTLPAVSGPNGKVEFGGGLADLNSTSSDDVFRGGAAFSFPVGDMFGIQADLSALDAFGDTAVGGAVHAFTRDPNSYLFGAYGGYVDAGAANIFYVGPEAELYLGNVSIEAIGGYMDVSTTGSKFYALGDIALYATDNLRLSIWGQRRLPVLSPGPVLGSNGSWPIRLMCRYPSLLMAVSATAALPRSWLASTCTSAAKTRA